MTVQPLQLTVLLRTPEWISGGRFAAGEWRGRKGRKERVRDGGRKEGREGERGVMEGAIKKRGGKGDFTMHVFRGALMRRL